MPSAALLARTTIATAFQRMNARIRFSTSSSPGYQGCASRGIVLMYGVETVGEVSTLSSVARSARRPMRYSARLRPRCSDTAVNASSHSAVSVGSMSGSWWRNPSVDVIRFRLPTGWETRVATRR